MHNVDQVQPIDVEFSSGTPPLPASAELCTVQNQSSAHPDCQLQTAVRSDYEIGFIFAFRGGEHKIK